MSICAEHDFKVKTGDKEVSTNFYGAYDGHGGDTVSEFLAQSMHGHVAEFGGFIENPLECLKGAFKSMDRRVLKEHQAMSHACGSCCTILTIRPETKKLYAAWCGDSRCVLSRNGKSVDLSTDHKPYVPSEVQRIEAAGGHVEDNRVCGNLAVSRAIGDYMMKDFKEEHAQLKKEGQTKPFTADLVVSDADVSETSWMDDDEFVLIASDGVWDKISSQEAVTFVRNKLKTSNQLGRIAEGLCDMAIDARSGDNCCVIIVMLKEPSFADEDDETAAEDGSQAEESKGASRKQMYTTVDVSSDGSIEGKLRKSVAELHKTK